MTDHTERDELLAQMTQLQRGIRILINKYELKASIADKRARASHVTGNFRLEGINTTDQQRWAVIAEELRKLLESSS